MRPPAAAACGRGAFLLRLRPVRGAEKRGGERKRPGFRPPGRASAAAAAQAGGASPLPYSLDIQLHNYANLSDGSQLDNGFAGALKAPGFYCSGYREVNGTLQKAGNRQAAYLFVTGNWLNFQKVYGFLYYQKIANGAWAPSNRPIYYSHFYDGFKSEPYPLTDVEEWPQLDYSLAYPGGGENYKNR